MANVVKNLYSFSYVSFLFLCAGECLYNVEEIVTKFIGAHPRSRINYNAGIVYSLFIMRNNSIKYCHFDVLI